MNAVRINSSTFKAEVGRGMGLSGGYFVDQTTAYAPSPPPSLPLKGRDGAGIRVIALCAAWTGAVLRDRPAIIADAVADGGTHGRFALVCGSSRGVARELRRGRLYIFQPEPS